MLLTKNEQKQLKTGSNGLEKPTGPTREFDKNGKFNGGTRIWWQNYDMAAAYVKKHKTWRSCGPKLQSKSWISNTRLAHKDGKLEDYQIKELEKIEFPFEAGYRYGRGHGNKLAAAADLSLKFHLYGKDLLRPKEIEQHKKNMANYLSELNNGKISTEQAKKLGLDIYHPHLTL